MSTDGSNIGNDPVAKEQLAKMDALGCVARPLAMDYDRWPPGHVGGINPQDYNFSNNGYLMQEKFELECTKYGITPTPSPSNAFNSVQQTADAAPNVDGPNVSNPDQHLGFERTS